MPRPTPVRPRAALVAVALAGTLGAVLVAAVGADEGAADTDPPPTVEVGRRDLTASIAADGVLERSGTRFVHWQPPDATPASALGWTASPTQTPPAEPGAVPADQGGTITAVVAVGATVDTGDVLFQVDGRPTVLMLGPEVTYRELSAGVADGPDVAQLEQNLAALGFTGGSHELTVDQHFDAATTEAVEAWQESSGVEQTGVVAHGDVLFLPEPVTVTATARHVGDPVQPGAHVLDVATETLVATAALPVVQRSEVVAGSAVTLTLADRSTVGGTVLAVGAEATRPADQEVTESTVDVTVQLDGTDSPAAVDGATVSLAIATEVSSGALAVPVAAVVDGGGGQPAVAVVADGGDGAAEDGPAQLVPVELGLVAGGYVEVAGGALEEGNRIVLPGDEPDDVARRHDGGT